MTILFDPYARSMHTCCAQLRAAKCLMVPTLCCARFFLRPSYTLFSKQHAYCWKYGIDGHWRGMILAISGTRGGKGTGLSPGTELHKTSHQEKQHPYRSGVHAAGSSRCKSFNQNYSWRLLSTENLCNGPLATMALFLVWRIVTQKHPEPPDV